MSLLESPKEEIVVECLRQKERAETAEAKCDRLAHELGQTRKHETFARHAAEVRLESHWRQHYAAEAEKERDAARRRIAELEATVERLHKESAGAFAWWLDGTGADIESSGVAGRAIYKNVVVAVDAFRAALAKEAPDAD